MPILLQDNFGSHLVISGTTAEWGNITGDISTQTDLGKTNNAIGYDLAGGTTNKVLTVSENSTIDQNLSTTAFVIHDELQISSLLSSDLLGTDINGKIVAVLIANATDIQNQTPGRILDASIVIDEDTMVSDSDTRVPTQQSVVAYVANQLAGGVTYRGLMPVPADLTTNTTGNAYADSTSSYQVGDMFIADSTGLLTVADGTISVNAGDAFIINTDTPDASITVAMVDHIDASTEVTAVFGRTGSIVASNGDYTASQITNIASGDIVAINVQDALNELDLEKVSKSTLTTKGDIFVRNATDIVRLPVGADGDTLVANSLAASGVEWSSNGSSGSVPNSYCVYVLSASVTTNVGNGDHCKFDTTLFNVDPLNLQTLGTLPYTTADGVNCIGRVLLKAGYYYRITGYVAPITASFCGNSIFDVTSIASRIGTRGNSFAAINQNSNANSVPSFAYVEATTDRIIELRKTFGTISQWFFGGNSGIAECFLSVEVVGVI